MVDQLADLHPISIRYFGISFHSMTEETKNSKDPGQTIFKAIFSI